MIGRPSTSRTRVDSVHSPRHVSADVASPRTFVSDRSSIAQGDTDVLERSTLASISRSWHGFSEILYNVIGTLGFIVGSLMWILGASSHGAYIFAASCLCCGISCIIYAVKFYRTDDLIGAYALMQQTTGCIIFIICSILFSNENYLIICEIGFFAASLLFLTGCILTQIQCRSWCGVWSPLCLGGRASIIPTSCFNTLGSILFTVGSVFLFYTWGQDLGAWCYEIGSIIFFLASWGDATIWWSLGLTQSEHQRATSFASTKFADNYAAVKFL